MMDQRTTILNTLEHMLVQEFRACQALNRLNREMRLAFIQGDGPGAYQLQARELALRQDLMVQEHGRQVVVEKLFQLFPQAEPASNGSARQAPELEALLDRLDPGTAARFGRLQEGIRILRAQTKTLTCANQKLAQKAPGNGLRNERLETSHPPATGAQPGRTGRAERIPAPSGLLRADPSGSYLLEAER